MPRRGMNAIFITEERKPPKPIGNFPSVSDVRAGVVYDTNMVGTLVITDGSAITLVDGNDTVIADNNGDPVTL